MIDLDEARLIICKAIWKNKLEIDFTQSIEAIGLIKIFSEDKVNGNIA